MASLYIHIPFCKHKCHYCNFYTHSSFKHQSALVDAIISEMELRKNYLGSQSLNSVYFGGGTPSVLKKEELNLIFSKINTTFSIKNDAEISFEVNPDDVNDSNLQLYKSLGINRLSIGIQSFDNEILKNLNRSHDSKTALEAINLIKDYNAFELNIDLIFGIPGLSNSLWEKTINQFLELKTDHLSAYFLTIETNTALSYLIKKNKFPKPLENEGLDHWQILHKMLSINNFEQYEISNWARNGKYSKHNLSYWNREPYLGVGPSAHSFDGNSRQWNFNGILPYIERVKTNGQFFEAEELSQNDRYNEYVMLGLRTQWGVDSNLILNEFGADFHDHFTNQLKNKKISNYLIINSNKVKLNWEGRQRADGIGSEFFVSE